jgi:hypothetical protein
MSARKTRASKPKARKTKPRKRPEEPVETFCAARHFNCVANVLDNAAQHMRGLAAVYNSTEPFDHGGMLEIPRKALEQAHHEVGRLLVLLPAVQS